MVDTAVYLTTIPTTTAGWRAHLSFSWADGGHQGRAGGLSVCGVPTKSIRLLPSTGCIRDFFSFNQVASVAGMTHFCVLPGNTGCK